MTCEDGTSAVERNVYGRLRSTFLSAVLLLVATLEPFLSFYSRNQHWYVQTGILLQWFVVAVLVVLCSYLLACRVLYYVEPLRIALVMAAFVYCFFRYASFGRDPHRSSLLSLGLWSFITLCAMVAVALGSRRQPVRLFLVLYIVVSMVIPGALVASSGPTAGPRHTATDVVREPIAVQVPAVRRPDVWWLVMDQYGRTDMLEKYHGYDNSDFIDSLEARAFRVSEDSHTSYTVTPLVLSSVLQLDYIAGGREDVREGLVSFSAPLSGGGRVVDAFREHGYKFLYADNGVFDWAECDPALADICVPGASDELGVGYLSRTLAGLTPLTELMPVGRIDVESTVDRTLGLMRADRSEFVFIHTLSPHEPYWYADDCEFRSRPIEMGFDSDRYIHQIECLNPRILNAIDAISAASPDSIIILQSDHGPGPSPLTTTPYENWSNDQLVDRYAILEAMKMPGECPGPEAIHTNVSTFEYVLACIEGRQPEPLPDRYFFWRWNDQYDVREIDLPSG